MNHVTPTETHPINPWLEQVRATLARELPRLAASLQEFPWRSRGAYAQWLAQTHAYVVHTTRLTALAAAFVQGPFASMHMPMLRHAGEEGGHDQLLIDDLAALGVDLAAHPPSPLATAFVQCLYYQIEHEHPLAIYGRVLPLEAIAAEIGARLHREVASAHGEASGTFLKAHSDADPEHIEGAFRILSPIGEAEARVIERGITLTVSLYVALLDSIVAGRGS